MDQKIILRYTGNAHLPGIPARDLTQVDIDEAGASIQQLLNSGLYERVVEKKLEKPARDNKMSAGSSENKGE